MEYISIPHEKILALVGFEPLPVEAQISEAHALPSELAGTGLLTVLCVAKNYNFLKNLQQLSKQLC